VVEGFVTRREGRQLYHEGEIRNEAGVLLARGEGRFVIIDREKYRTRRLASRE
jgi:acyl-CoA thioesterase FadM